MSITAPSLPTDEDLIVVQDFDTAITWTPSVSWRTQVKDSNGTTQRGTRYHLANFSYTFSGSEVWYYGEINYNHGPFSVEIDGVMAGGGTSLGPTKRLRALLYHTIVPAGQHTFTVTNTSENFTTIDYLKYRPVAEAVVSEPIQPPQTGSSRSSLSPPRSTATGTDPHSTVTSTAQPSTVTGTASTAQPRQTEIRPSSQKSAIYVGIALGAVCFLLLLAIGLLILRGRRHGRFISDPRRLRARRNLPPAQGHPQAHLIGFPAESVSQSLIRGLRRDYKLNLFSSEAVVEK